MRRAALAALLVAACSPLAPAPDAPDEDELDAPAPAPAHAATPSPAPAADASLPPGFEPLGGACPVSEEKQTRVVFVCSADRRVAAAHLLVQHGFDGRPRPGEELPPMPPGTVTVEGALQSPVRVFVDRERVWVAGACVYCRIPVMELRIVELPLAPEEQLTSLQAAAGIPMKPALRTAAAWREALARRPRR